MDEFVERMRCIPQMLAAQNRRLGRPLSPAELTDVSQEVFLRVWSQLDRFEGQAALETWVYRFCVLTLLDYLRKRRAIFSTHDMEESLEAEPSELGVDLDYDRVRAALDDLEPELREVVTLKLFDGHTFTEVGERLDCSPNTAKTRYYRGLFRLEQILGRAFRSDES